MPIIMSKKNKIEMKYLFNRKFNSINCMFQYQYFALIINFLNNSNFLPVYFLSHNYWFQILKNWKNFTKSLNQINYLIKYLLLYFDWFSVIKSNFHVISKISSIFIYFFPHVILLYFFLIKFFGMFYNSEPFFVLANKSHKHS